MTPRPSILPGWLLLLTLPGCAYDLDLSGKRCDRFGHDCPSGYYCALDGGAGVCKPGDGVCQPDCRGKACGDDGCGGSCGTCSAAAGETCNSGICQAPADACDAIGVEAFFSCYYDNVDFTDLAFTRTDDAIDFDWDYDDPRAGMGSDQFSVIWRGWFTFAAGVYEFAVTVDDGVRLFVDGTMVMDEWRKQAASFTTTVDLDAGTHLIEVHYYEDEWRAAITLGWSPG